MSQAFFGLVIVLAVCAAVGTFFTFYMHNNYCSKAAAHKYCGLCGAPMVWRVYSRRVGFDKRTGKEIYSKVYGRFCSAEEASNTLSFHDGFYGRNRPLTDVEVYYIETTQHPPPSSETPS